MAVSVACTEEHSDEDTLHKDDAPSTMMPVMHKQCARKPASCLQTSFTLMLSIGTT